MLSTRSLLYRIIFLVPALFSLILGISSCATKVAAFTPLTVLSIVGGNVLVEKPGTNNWNNGQEGMTLEADDKIKTDVGASASITFFDGSTIDLDGSTEISLDELLSKSSTSPKTIKIGQTIGETSSSIVKAVDPASRYEVDTPAGVAAVGGSKMVVTVATDGTTQVYNVEGIVSFMAQGQEVMIPVGSVSLAKPGEVPNTPQPGIPPESNALSAMSISSRIGWQQSSLYLNAGDKFYVEYKGGSWSADYANLPYVGPAGYSADINKTITSGNKIDSSVPYGCLLSEVGNGEEIPIANKGGPFTADASGFLSLRINDTDTALRDNDGAITVNLRGPASKSTTKTVNNVSNVGWNIENNPYLQGNPLYAIWGSSSSDVFAVGAEGTILHYNGKAWSNMTLNAACSLWSVWGSSSSDVFAVGNVYNSPLSVILHYNGNTWSTITTGTTSQLNSVWGSSSSDIFAVGTEGTILHYNGKAWSTMTSGIKKELNGVWGSSASDVFAVGNASNGTGGTILHYDGKAWSIMSSTMDYLLAVWGSSSSDVLALGVDGTILHYDGNAWSTMTPSTVYPLFGVWGSSSSDVFAVGDGSTILHYNGKGWNTMTGSSYNGLNAVWGSSSSDVFAVGAQGTILYYDGKTWVIMTSGTTNQLNSIWGSGPIDVFAVGDKGPTLHYDGRAWTAVTNDTTDILNGFWGSAPSDVFGVGFDMNGEGLILQYNGETWSTIASNTNQLNSVWGSSSSDVFAVGDGGTILQYNGEAWSTVTSGTTNQLNSVWGSSSSDVFAAGVTGTILHYDGKAWSIMTSGTTNQLNSIWGNSSSDVFAVGDGGIILRYNGETWSTITSGTMNQLNSVWGSSSSDVFAVGDGGLILHYSP